MNDGSRSYTGAASLLVLAVAFTGLFLGVENWWVAFVVGYGAVVPLIAMLTGEDEESEEAEHIADATTDDRARDRTDASDSKSDALDTLRERYARGELSEQQFEAKLERLLETETLEDAREDVERRDRTDDATSESRDRELEYE